jgi:hypothetical protein
MVRTRESDNHTAAPQLGDESRGIKLPGGVGETRALTTCLIDT